MGIRTNKLVVVGALGVSALGLIGLGASASFTDAVSATQTINTGTLCLNISSVDRNGNSDGTLSGDGKTISFKPGNKGGSQIDEKHMVFATNGCSLPLYVKTVSFLASGGGKDPAPLGDDVQANFARIIGSVRSIEFTYNCFNCGLFPGQTLALDGDVGTRMEFSGNLGNADEGQTITPTITFNAIEWNATAPSGPATLSSGG